MLHSMFLDAVRRDIASGMSEADATAAAMDTSRKALGGRLISMSVGSAPPSPAVVAWTRTCFHHCFVSEGYGCTETGTISIDHKVFMGVQACLLELPEMGYTVNDKPHPRGEICVRTPALFAGYNNAADATSAAFVTIGGASFYRTGDLGQYEAAAGVARRVPDAGPPRCLKLQPGDLMRVVGRVKSAAKLADGEFVSPESVEQALQPSECVDQVLVAVHDGVDRAPTRTILVPNGSPLSPETFATRVFVRQALVALIVPNREALLSKMESAVARTSQDSVADAAAAAQLHSNRTRLVTSLVTRLRSCNALQGCYKGVTRVITRGAPL
jgi:long-subunit acyl-CoA synthetase (AMP-forming)